MANLWLRLYAEFAHDPKVQIMPEAMQRRLVMLFCLQCSDVLVTLNIAEIAFQLRISEQELEETRKLFVAKGFIDDNWNLLNWSTRQYESDNSTARVRRFRGKKQNETFHVTPNETPETKRAVTVTAPDTDTEADTEAEAEADTEAEAEKINAHADGVERVYRAYPRRVGKGKAIPAIERAVAHLAKESDLPKMTAPEALEYLHRRVQAFARSPAGQAGEYTPHAATWFNGKRYLDDDSEWQRTGDKYGTHQQHHGQTKFERLVDKQREALRECLDNIAHRGAVESASEVGGPAWGADDPTAAGIVLQGAR